MIRIVQRLFILLGLLIISFGSITAQIFLDPEKNPDQYNYQHWTSDNGLPDNAVIKIIQSSEGYIWFASYGGITRFNGVDFYTYSSYNTPEIVNNSFTSIYESSDGTIWAATSGNGIVSIKNNIAKAYSTLEGLPGNFAEGFTQTNDGKLWVVTSSGLAYLKDGKFSSQEVPDYLKTMNLVSITTDDKDHLWIASLDQGIYEIFKNQILNHYTKETGLMTNEVNYIKYQKGKIYIGCTTGLNVIDKGNITQYSISNGLLENNITTSDLSDNDWLWIGGYKNICRVRNNEFQYFSNQHPIYGRDVTSILEDTEGNLWVGTYRGGLYKFWEGKFTNYCDYSISHSLPYTVHTVLKKTKDKIILIYEEGVSEINLKTKTLMPFSKQMTGLSDKLKCGIFDHNNQFWIGTQHGLIKYADDKIKILTVSDGLINDNIRVVFEDTQNRLWVGTVGGITVFDFGKGTHFNITINEGLSHDYIMSIVEDDKGNFWIGTRSGLCYYDKGKISKFDISDGLMGEFVFKTFFDSEGTLWIAGNAGLSRYKNNEFHSITSKNGLKSNTIFQILEDDLGYFWFTTNQKNVSVFKVKKNELDDFMDGKINHVNSIAYDRSDGIKASAATSSSNSLKSNDGKLWFATQYGVEVIDPLNIDQNQIKPPVNIEYFKVNDQLILKDSDIKMPFAKNRITIGFAGLSYRYPANNTFKYQLIGYDDNWIISKGEQETSYTNLSPGRYTFKVIAANNDNYWNENAAEIEFRIEPAFYQTYWFYVLCAILIIAFVYFIYLYRVNSMKFAQIELEKIVEERTYEILQKKEEIETQNEEIDSQRDQILKQHDELKKINLNLEDIVGQRTTELKQTYRELLDVNKELDTFIYRSVHDIRGPIARLQGLSQLIKMQSDEEGILNLVGMLNKTAEEMNDVFYRLINIVRLKTSDLVFNEVDLERIVTNVIDKFSSQPLREEFRVSINITPNLSLRSNEETIDVILYQVIDNAIKFKKPGEQANLKIVGKRNNEGYIQVNISDNGVGIDVSQSEKIFDMFFVGNDRISSSGLGLYTVKTAVKVLKGNVKLVQNSKLDGVTTFELTFFDHK